MAQQRGDEEKMEEEKEAAKEVGKRTARDPIIMAAAGSVLLAWFQFYVRGNKQHGLFIGLWPPTLLAFSNAVRINNISRKIAGETKDLVDMMTQDQ